MEWYYISNNTLEFVENGGTLDPDDMVQTAVHRLPFSVISQDRIIGLVLSLDTELPNCFLYTEPEYIDVLQARLIPNGDYKEVKEYSTHPRCYLGLLSGQNVIVLKINFPSGFIGEQVVPLYLGYGTTEITSVSLNFWADNELAFFNEDDFWLLVT
jgi:hypothetical protein